MFNFKHLTFGFGAVYSFTIDILATPGLPCFKDNAFYSYSQNFLIFFFTFIFSTI